MVYNRIVDIDSAITVKHCLVIGLLILITIPGIAALLHPGFYTSHDGRHQITRLVHFHQGLVDGQLPVRWAGFALRGYGYPLFVFTYRLPFWFAEAWYRVFGDLGNAIKFSFILSFLISGIAMYWFLYLLTKSKLAALTGSVLYLWAPYRFVDIYVRAALGEAWTFVFIPLLFASIYGLATKAKKYGYWLEFTLGLAGMILSHMMTLIVFAVPLLIWLVIWFIKSPKKLAYTVFCVSSGLASILLTIYYWFPASYERSFTRFNDTIGAYYKDHFVTFKQLLYSPWGYGFSMPGTNDDMMSFSVGIVQWGVVVLILGLLVTWLVVKFLPTIKPLQTLAQTIEITSERLLIISFALLLFILSIYLMMSDGVWFFDLIAKVMVIDIPWKFLVVTVFTVALLAAMLIKSLKNIYVQIALMLVLIGVAVYGNRNHINVNQYVYYPDSEYFQSNETSNQYDDYMPKDFDTGALADRDPQLAVISGTAQTKLLKRTSNAFQFLAQVESNQSNIATKLANYPGWELSVDGVKKELVAEQGRIIVNLPKGKHIVSLRFGETPWRLGSNLISLLSLLGIVFYTIRELIWKNVKK